MVSRYRHGPGVVFVMETSEELGGIGNVLCGVEHFSNGFEFRTVEVDVDLHAADVDQLCAVASCVVHQLIGFGKAGRKKGLALDVDGIGAERSLAARLRQSDGIEDAFWYVILTGCRLDLTLAVQTRCGLRCLTGKRGQGERW